MHALLYTLLLLPPFILADNNHQSSAASAWREFSQQLGSAGAEILSTYPQPTATDSAEGLRYLLQQVSSASQYRLLNQPGEIPLLRIGATTINKWGLDGADAKYQGAHLLSGGNYRFYGQLGSARIFALQLARMAGTYAAYGALTGEQLQADSAGNFEILISEKKPDSWQGAWLQLNSEADHLLVREYFRDWGNERPGSYYLERLDNVTPSAPLTNEQAASLLSETVKSFSIRASQWKKLIEQARKHAVNTVHLQKADDQGLEANAYGSGWFKIDRNEALVIELDAPEALLWSVQLGNVWWESIDYINHTASYNDNQAAVSSDGKYRFVLSLKDPGVPNWLDPNGHTEGAILFRMQKYRKLTSPIMKLIPLSVLAETLPQDTVKVSKEQRLHEITARRRHAAIRWAP